jgi:uncharacterized protein YciI
MKRFFLGSLFACISLFGNAQASNPNYDKALADSLGANEYGMKAYVLVILKTGSNTSLAKNESDSLFAGHMKNIMRLADEGKLVVSGPMKKNDRSYRGIFILNVPSIEDDKSLMAADPAITGKLLDVEYYQWFGSAALPMYLPFHKKIEKTNM